MNKLVRLGAPLLFILVLFFSLWTPPSSTAAAGKRYVCVSCSLPCDTLSFSAPGVCPACGMALVDAEAAAAQSAPEPDRRKVAILVFNGAEILDFSGPYEMFGAAGCDVYTVAATKDPVTTAMGLSVVPKFSFADAPQPDVLVIPGGAVKGAANSAPTLQYIKDVTEHTQNTMSVCNGAFILANTGLLDGLGATTTNGNLARLESQYPKIKVVRDQRYVDNGKIITTAGLSAGMDGALHVIEKLFGTGTAQQVALGEEYDWKAGAGYARAALADQQIPDFKLNDLGTWDVVRTEGDTRHWDVVVRGEPKAPAELATRLEETLAKANWTRVRSEGGSATTRTSKWKFTGRDGKPWTGSMKIAPADATGRHFTAAVSIARAG